MRRNVKTSKNRKTIEAVTHIYTQVNANKIIKDKSRDRKIFCCF